MVGTKQPRWGLPSLFELLGLWAISVAYPILSAAVSGPEGLTAVRADRLDAVGFLLLILLAGPLIAFLAEALLRQLAGLRTAQIAHLAFLALFSLPFFVRAGSALGLEGYPGLLLGLILALAFAALWWRTRFGQSLVSVISFATPVVVVVFALSAPVQALFTPEPRDTGPLEAERRVPVVFLLLDELPLAALEREPGKLDAKRFPHFARLARQATWYSRARTEADSTVVAIPLVASGLNKAEQEPAPGLADYPDNFLSVLARAGYDVYGSEWITDLCPHDVCPRSRDFKRRFFRFLTNGLTFGRPLPLPGDEDLDLTVRIRKRFDPQPGQPFRVRELARAIRSGRYDAYFLHLMLPHVPWIMLPDGRTHDAPSVEIEFEGGDGRIHQDVQRMLLQVKYVDNALGQIAGAMQEAGIWEESLFVVAADHGAMMEGGGTRRIVTRENAPWIAPVPLFIKYPGQSEGRLVETPVSTGDIFPTVAEELGLPLQIPGRHHLDSPGARVSEHRIDAAESAPSIEISEAELQAGYEAAVARARAAFPDPDLYATDGAAELLGRRADRIDGLRPVDARLDDPAKFRRVDLKHSPLPVYVSGVIEDADISEATPLVIAVNGRIAATMRAWKEGENRVFGTVVEPRFLVKGDNEIAIYARDAA